MSEYNILSFYQLIYFLLIFMYIFGFKRNFITLRPRRVRKGKKTEPELNTIILGNWYQFKFNQIPCQQNASQNPKSFPRFFQMICFARLEPQIMYQLKIPFVSEEFDNYSKHIQGKGSLLKLKNLHVWMLNNISLKQK